MNNQLELLAIEATYKNKMQELLKRYEKIANQQGGDDQWHLYS